MRQITDTSEIVPLIKEVCMALLEHADDNEVSLMLGTWAAENGAFHRKQIGGGPARGLWQMEASTGVDIFMNYLKFRMDKYSKLIQIWIDMNWLNFCPPMWIPHYETISRHLGKYDDFACAMARIHYLRDPDPIPDTLEGQAAYWKRIYNTPGGAHDEAWYLSQWAACRCDVLLGG